MNLIFGDDERATLKESQYTKFPFRTICYIKLHFDTDGYGVNDLSTYGTGALVGPSTVLTASHVIFHSTKKIWPTKVEVSPGGHYSNGTFIAPYGTTTTCKKLTVGTYYNTSDPNDDWGFIDLYKDFGSDLGYFGTSSELSVGDTVRLYGYHGDLNGQLGYGPGSVTNVSTYKFRHNCDAISESSGGPITLGTTTIVGIHSGGYNNDEDQACKVSSYIVKWINDRLLED